MKEFAKRLFALELEHGSAFTIGPSRSAQAGVLGPSPVLHATIPKPGGRVDHILLRNLIGKLTAHLEAPEVRAELARYGLNEIPKLRMVRYSVGFRKPRFAKPDIQMQIRMLDLELRLPEPALHRLSKLLKGKRRGLARQAALNGGRSESSG